MVYLQNFKNSNLFFKKNYTNLYHFTMAPHSSTLAWKIPRTEEPGGPQSMESLRVGHDWASSLSLFTFIYWRRKWQPTPVFLPGESQGRGSLVGFRLWGHTESDTTDVTAAAAAAAYPFTSIFSYTLTNTYIELCLFDILTWHAH